MAIGNPLPWEHFWWHRRRWCWGRGWGRHWGVQLRYGGEAEIETLIRNTLFILPQSSVLWVSRQKGWSWSQWSVNTKNNLSTPGRSHFHHQSLNCCKTTNPIPFMMSTGVPITRFCINAFHVNSQQAGKQMEGGQKRINRQRFVKENRLLPSFFQTW